MNIRNDIEIDKPIDELIKHGIVILGDGYNIINIYCNNRTIRTPIIDGIYHIEVYENNIKLAHIKVHNYDNKEIFYMESIDYKITICVKFKGELK